MKLDVVVGAQYGSEAKGHVTQRLLERFRQDWTDFGNEAREPRILNIRVAGPNAGHTAHDVDGQPVAFRCVPVGALIPGVTCAIAAGSEIDPRVLLPELELASERRYGDDPFRMVIDRNATVLEPRHVEAERGMHEAMGSTGKGIGAARADRIMRKAARVADHERTLGIIHRMRVMEGDVAALASNGYWDYVVVEGTQGYGLGLHTADYPHTTSSDCRAIDFLAMAGINPWMYLPGDDLITLTIWAVARVYPIRVAGPSGRLKDETSWGELGLPEERTTVTKKVRRVGGWDQDLVNEAVRANGGGPVVKLAVTMLDQKYPELRDVRETHRVAAHKDAMRWLGEVSNQALASVRMVTTGPNSGVFL